MIISVLWEDSRAVATNRFGAHELLLACLIDELRRERASLNDRLKSLPKNGNANVRKALKYDLRHLLRHGPVIAVLDRDQFHELLPKQPPPPACRAGIIALFRLDTGGHYDLVLLEDAMETLVEVTCHVLRRAVPPKGTEERDRVLGRAAWESVDARAAIRKQCPSFDRLVMRVAAYLGPQQ